MCYLCCEDLSHTGYAHFCSNFNCDHKTCNKCKLYTNSVEDDRVAMRDAGLMALQVNTKGCSF
jgi:hypothetical protein